MFRLLLFASLAVAGLLSADTILFVDDQTLEGDVLAVTDTTVTVKMSKGTFTFPKERVVRIDYSYEKRLARIVDGDFKAHYDLGLWCLANGQNDNALAEFLTCTGQPGVPDDAFLKLAEIHLKKGQNDLAAAQYALYLQRHPDDLLVSKKAEALAPAAPAAGAAPAMRKADEGLEILPGWRVEKWGNPGVITVARTVANQVENQVLKIACEGKTGDKVALRLQVKSDLSRYAACAFDAFNPDAAPLSMAIAFVTAPTYDWYESRTVLLKPGWNLNVRFDLNSTAYKTKDTAWDFKSDIKNRQNTEQFILLPYNGSRAIEIILDNIRFE
ncbi:MAG: hypothetical protein ABIF71_09045 [Planctomycetota bacterium]